MLVETADSTKARTRLNDEVLRSPVSDSLKIPEDAAMEAARLRGDKFLLDPADNGSPKGAFAWISAEPDWKEPKELFAVHIWGPSERHLDILIDVCQWGVDNGLGDLPVTYQRSTHPMVRIADQYASVTFSPDGKFSTTTLRSALKSLTARRGEVARGVVTLR